MKSVFYIPLILSLLVFSTSSRAQEQLNNQSIIDMIELGFDENIIESKIKSSNVSFDTDIKSLKILKSKGLSSKLISLMIKKSSYKTKLKAGIYYSLAGKKHRISPNVFSGQNTNIIAYAFSSGIANAKIKAYITSAQSVNVLPSTEDLSFVFHFDPSSSDNQLNTTNWWFKTASSPQEFVLLRMKQKHRKNRREVIIGKFGLASGGSSTGTESKNAIPFTSEEIGDGIYNTVPKQKLLSGEYCFFYKGTIPGGGYTNQSVFDFSVK